MELDFKVNPYDPCIANRMINSKQHTITWHVDNVKSSHVEKIVNDNFCDWLKNKCGSDGIGEVKTTRGKKHEYLGMILDYSTKCVLIVDMINTL